MIPLGEAGGIQDKVTVVLVIFTTISNLGAVGTIEKHIQNITKYGSTYIVVGIDKDIYGFPKMHLDK